LPAKQKARRDKLAQLKSETRSIVLYESVHRIRDCLADLVAEFGTDRNAFIGRELTKLHEQCVQAPLGDLLRRLDEGDIVSKGEFVVVVTGSNEEQTSTFEVDQLLTELMAHLPPKDAAKIAARVTGTKRNDLYERLLHLKSRR
jgi:16S rRNA (cytidine1402-2'-O)-methyltransferase